LADAVCITERPAPGGIFQASEREDRGGLAAMFQDADGITIIIKQALPAQACAMHGVVAVDT